MEPLNVLYFSAAVIGYRIEGKGKKRFVQFEIICTCQLSEESKFYTSGSPFEWRIWKRYSEFYALLHELNALRDTDFYKAESAILDVDPKILMKRIRKAFFPPKYDITLKDRFSSSFIKERLYDMIEWFQSIRKIEPLFNFNYHSKCSHPMRRFLDIDYTLYLRKNDEWYAKDRRSLVNYDDHDAVDKEGVNSYDTKDARGEQEAGENENGAGGCIIM